MGVTFGVAVLLAVDDDDIDITKITLSQCAVLLVFVRSHVFLGPGILLQFCCRQCFLLLILENNAFSSTFVA